jgi:hypothetical protein
MPTSGDPRLTNQLGMRGVSRRNIMYQNRFCLLALTMAWNLWKRAGNLLRTSDLARV